MKVESIIIITGGNRKTLWDVATRVTIPEKRGVGTHALSNAEGFAISSWDSIKTRLE